MLGRGKILSGIPWGAPGSIGAVTPNSAAFTDVTIGTSSSKQTLTTAATKAIRIYTTTAITTAIQISSVEINQYRTADSSVNGRDWALKVNLSSTHKYPSGANAIYGSMTFVAAGVHGRGAALQGEIILPNAQIVRGTISCCTLEMSQGANTNSGSSGPVSFISCVAAGTLTDLDARGYLFEITGVSEGDGKFCDNGGSPSEADGGIRCLINGNVRYLLYANDAET